jgi:hypothetical protein
VKRKRIDRKRERERESTKDKKEIRKREKWKKGLRERLKDTGVERKKIEKEQYPFTNTQYEIPKKSRKIRLKL